MLRDPFSQTTIASIYHASIKPTTFEDGESEMSAPVKIKNFKNKFKKKGKSREMAVRE